MCYDWCTCYVILKPLNQKTYVSQECQTICQHVIVLRN